MVDDPRANLPLGPGPLSIPEANRRRLEELLQELLRDKTIRELFCNSQQFKPEPHTDRSPRRLKISLRLVTGGAR